VARSLENSQYSSETVSETQSIASKLSQCLKPGSVVVFLGDLGAGKTTFIKRLIQEIALLPEDDVQSPTFTYLHIFEGKTPIYHFDLYRLKTLEDFCALGFDEYLETPDGICLIEWPGVIQSILPKDTFYIQIAYLSETARQITITQNDENEILKV